SKATDGVMVDSENKLWRQDVFAALSEWIKLGMPSFTWDQFAGGRELISLIKEVRGLARTRDPQSTFGGEAGNLELDSSVLDYTWVWVDYEAGSLAGRREQIVDAPPITNVLRSPRLNCNV